MNAKQRRLVRRAVEQFDHEAIASYNGDDYTPRVTDRVFRLLMRAPAAFYGRYSSRAYRTSWVGFWHGRRDPRTYGLRCHCGRKAHGFGGDKDDTPLCREHVREDWLEEMPF